MVDQIHGCSRAHPAADGGSSLGNDTEQASPGPSARPTRACTRTPPRLNPMAHGTEACIRACVKNILAKRLLVGGLTCHFAPAAEPSRVPYISINRSVLLSCCFEFVLLGIALNRIGWCS